MKGLGYGVVVILMCSIGCADEGQFMEPENARNESEVQFDNYEAEVAALWVSEELTAPADLYSELEAGFARVRNEFGDSIPDLNSVYFVEPWIANELLCELTTQAVQEMRNGEYTDLDSLNSLYGLAAIDTSLFFHRVWWIRLSFNDVYHPERLGEIYELVPSVIQATPNGYWWPYYNAYPWYIGGGTSYLFRQGWSDCQSGCVYHRYWYFWVIGETVELIGTWDTFVDPNPPDWWVYGQIAYYYYEEGELPIGTGIGD